MISAQSSSAAGDAPHIPVRLAHLPHVHGPLPGLVGDITPTCGVSDEEKHLLEAAGIGKLKALLGGGPAADEMEELWREYEAGETTEAALVKDFDKVQGTWWHQTAFP